MDFDSPCRSFRLPRPLVPLLLVLANVSAWSQVSFDKPDIDVGRGPHSIAQADFNRDGRPDLVTANSFDNTLSVLLNKGDGTFHRQDYPTGLHPNVVVAADFNGDGIPDVAVGGDTGITIFFGRKDGRLRRVAFIATPDEVTGMVAADFDGDGRPDLATVRARSGVVSIYTRTGSTPFFHVADYATAVRGSPLGFPVTIPALGLSSTIAAADFNGDGILDLAVANGNFTSVAIFLGLGGGAFTSAPDVVTSDLALASVAVMDFNRDGVPDLWVTTEICPQNAEGCSFFTNTYAGQGDGSFVLQNRFFRDSNPSFGAPAIVDLNGDGIPDIVTPTLFDGVEISFAGPQGPSIPFSAFFPAGVGVTSLAVADFDGDGTPDIATANAYDDTVTILIGDGHGKFHSRLRTPMSIIFNGAVPADLNGDGLTDIVFTGIYPFAGTYPVTGIWVALGSGNGVFSKPQETQHDFAASHVAVVDVNGDGIPDVIAIGNDLSGSIATPATRVLLGKGDGTFSKAFQFAGAGDKLLVADFNGDGVPDILVRDTNLGVSLGNGDGTFRPPVETPYLLPGQFTSDMAAGDFDGDGKTDVIIAYTSGTPQLKLFSGNGNGTFRPGRTLATFPGDYIQFIVAADFNRDGILDFVVSHGPALTLFLGNGDGSFRQGASIPLRRSDGLNGISGLQVADINNDGLPDLVISSDRVSVLVNNGDGTFQPRQDFAIGGVGSLAIADFTGHAKQDIASFSQDLVMLVNTTAPAEPDFKFTLRSSQASLTPGQSQVIGGIVAALGPFDQGISFSCDGLPRGASCKFDPPRLALTENATASIALTISATGPTTVSRAQSGSLPGIFAFLLPLLGVLMAGSRQTKPFRILAILAFLLVVIPSLQGCGTPGGNRAVQGTAPSATPAGTYTIAVTAVSGGPEKITHVQTVLLTIH